MAAPQYVRSSVASSVYSNSSSYSDDSPLDSIMKLLMEGDEPTSTSASLEPQTVGKAQPNIARAPPPALNLPVKEYDGSTSKLRKPGTRPPSSPLLHTRFRASVATEADDTSFVDMHRYDDNFQELEVRRMADQDVSSPGYSQYGQPFYALEGDMKPPPSPTPSSPSALGSHSPRPDSPRDSWATQRTGKTWTSDMDMDGRSDIRGTWRSSASGRTGLDPFSYREYEAPRIIPPKVVIHSPARSPEPPLHPESLEPPPPVQQQSQRRAPSGIIGGYNFSRPMRVARPAEEPPPSTDPAQFNESTLSAILDEPPPTSYIERSQSPVKGKPLIFRSATPEQHPAATQETSPQEPPQQHGNSIPYSTPQPKDLYQSQDAFNFPRTPPSAPDSMPSRPYSPHYSPHQYSANETHLPPPQALEPVKNRSHSPTEPRQPNYRQGDSRLHTRSPGSSQHSLEQYSPSPSNLVSPTPPLNYTRAHDRGRPVSPQDRRQEAPGGYPGTSPAPPPVMPPQGPSSIAPESQGHYPPAPQRSVVPIPNSPPSRPTSSHSVYSAYSYYELGTNTPSTPGHLTPTQSHDGHRGTPTGRSNAHSPSRSLSPNGLLAPNATPQTPEDFLTLGIQHHEANRLRESARCFERSARDQGGCGGGMLMWGLSLRHGWGCEKDEKKGFWWLRKAAEAAVADLDVVKDGGDMKAVKNELVLAIYEVGQCFFHGWGVVQDKKMAVSYFQVAARLGDADAQQELGFCYANGKGCKKDLKEAARWYRAAAAQGASTVGLAWIYKPKYT